MEKRNFGTFELEILELRNHGFGNIENLELSEREFGSLEPELGLWNLEFETSELGIRNHREFGTLEPGSWFFLRYLQPGIRDLEP